jgi:hypothetical protein
MELFIWHFCFLFFFFAIDEVLIIWIIIIFHKKFPHRITSCDFIHWKIQMDIFFLNCNWLLSKYFQCIVLLFNLKFLLSLSLGLILSFNFKTLIVFICNCYLDILQFGRLQTKCLIVFIIKHFMVLISRNYLTLWFLLHNLRFILLYKHKWRLIKCLFFHDWFVLIYQNLLLKLIFLDLIWEIIICKCHCF